MIVVALITGVLGLVASWALRRPTERAKRLRKSEGVADERMMLASLPGISFILLGIGLAGLVAPGLGGFLGMTVGILLLLPCIALIGFGAYLSVLGLGKGPLPSWLLPEK